MKPYDGRNHPQSWLHDPGETLASETLNDSLGNQTDVMQNPVNSDPDLNENSLTFEHEGPIPHDISEIKSSEYTETNAGNTRY